MVLWAVVLVRCPLDSELRVRYDLAHSRSIRAYLAEEDLDIAAVDVGVLVTVVDQDTYLFGTDLLSAEAEDKEQGVDDVRFARAVWTNYRIKTLSRIQ